ncbi:MAG: DUF927 domain-containing protein, partial [Methanohalobium sp.]|uniref:DUF927 domain-containing protein n=1 Tax=Methanohalobium sp. TaxID=2837493 RepID=UPI00397A2D29
MKNGNQSSKSQSRSFRSSIDEIKNNIDIVELIDNDENTTRLNKRKSDEYRGSILPVGKSGDSLVVNRNKQTWYCHKNKTGGDVLDWLAYTNDLDIKSDFKSVLSIAAEEANVDLDSYDINTEKLQEKRKVFDTLTSIIKDYHNHLSDEIIELIENQYGLNRDTIEKYQIGFAPDFETHKSIIKKYDQHDLLLTGLYMKSKNGYIIPLYQSRIVFPYWGANKVVYSTARKTTYTPDNEFEGAKYKKHAHRSEKHPYVSEYIYNRVFTDIADDSDYVLFSEGITDAMLASQLGFSVASPVTTRFDKNNVDEIAKLVSGKDVYICFDNDDNGSGQTGALKTALQLEQNNVTAKIVELPRPQNSKSIDFVEYMKEHSLDDFMQLLDDARYPYQIELSTYKIKDTSKENLASARYFINDNLLHFYPDDIQAIVEDEVCNHFMIKSNQKRNLLKYSKEQKQKRDQQIHQEKIEQQIEEETSSSSNYFGVEIPRPYALSDDGIFKQMYNPDSGNIDFVKINHRPSAITAIGDSLDNNSNWFNIEFLDYKSNHKTITASQTQTHTKDGLKQLLKKGLPVLEQKMNQLSEFYVEQIMNCELPYFVVAEKNGWKTNNRFVHGNTLYEFDGDEIYTTEVYNTDENTSDKINKHGTLQGWIEAVKPFMDDYVVRFKMYSSVATALLKILNSSSFLICHSGASSRGKTFSSLLSLSIHGDISEEGLFQTFNGTDVAVEKSCESLCDLPVLFDEISTCSDWFIKNQIYTIASGKGYMRGKTEGGEVKLRETPSWRTVGMLTGERDITSAISNAGEQVRTIQIHRGMKQFDKVFIQNQQEKLSENNGHIFELFLEKLNQNRNRIKQLHTHYLEKFKNQVTEQTAQRKAGYYAVLATAGDLLEDIFSDIGIEPKNAFDVCNDIFDEDVVRNGVESNDVRSLRVIMDYVQQYKKNFIRELDYRIPDHTTADEEMDFIDLQDKIKDKQDGRDLYGWFTEDDKIHLIPSVAEKWMPDGMT